MCHLQAKPFLQCSPVTPGYSLAELAIVLAIIGLVSGMTLSVGKVQMNVAEVQGTKERLETIRAALLLFQKKHDRYPCPALLGDTAANASYGVEKADCATDCTGLTCDNSAVIGALPFKTLRLNEEMAYDSWDGKFDYIVDKNHTAVSDYNTGGIPIMDINGNEITGSPVLGDAIFVLVSHGKDSKGAYGKAGTLVTACGATGKDIENCNGDDTFVDSRFTMGDIAANYYDDLITWQTQENVQPAAAPPTYNFPLSLGAFLTCAGKSDGTVWCWGYNTQGNLGDGTTTERHTPVQVAGVSTASPAVSGSVSDIGGCYIKPDTTVWCWGDNDGSWTGVPGVIGNGDTAPNFYSTAVQVTGLSGVTQVSAGETSSCALKNDGTLWCWGGNFFGEVGDGTNTQRATPVQVVSLGTNVASVKVGDGEACAVKKDGTAWCWGNNVDGQLGDGTNVNRSTPVQVAGLTNVIQVDTDHFTSWALKSDGTVWAWGSNAWEELGDGTPIGRNTAGQVPGITNAIAVYGYCALKSDMTMWCWNNSGSNQIMTNVAELGSRGDGHMCARKNDGTIWCIWGNSNGQLGDGTTTDSMTPVQVLNFP